MKNRPIAFQIWFIMTAFVIFISIIVLLTVSYTINRYFLDKTFEEVKKSQLEEMGKGNLSSLNSSLEKALVVSSSNIKKHILISKKELSDRTDLTGVAMTVSKNILKQNSYYGEYNKSYNSLKLFYTVRSFLYNNEPCYLVTIYWDKEQNKVIYDFIKSLVKVISIAMVINITLAQLVSRSLTAPIRYMEKKVSEFAQKEWDTDIEVNRKDELGRLAASINMMKDSLKQKDLEEQTFIQTISHDLKTPVMIIRSYVQALMDKLYVNNSYEDTVQVIDNAAIRLETKLEKLLYLYSFDYIMNNIKEYEEVDLKQMLVFIANEISLCRKEIDIYVDAPDISITGSRADLIQAFENILENNLRYARSHIRISVSRSAQESVGVGGPSVEIEFFNDGLPIDDDVIKNLFNKYKKGKSGKFGLGLFITKKIIEFHKGEIRAENLDNGVVFRVVLPLEYAARETSEKPVRY